MVSQKAIGRLLDRPVVKETTNAAGQIVRQVKDTSGAVIDYTVDKAGKIVSSQVISGTTQRRQ